MDAYQIRHDGPLTEAFKSRINTIRSERRISLSRLGIMVSLSGVYLSQILKPGEAKPLRSVHIPRLARVVDEIESGLKARRHDLGRDDPTTLEDLVRAANALGFEVIFRPLGS